MKEEVSAVTNVVGYGLFGSDLVMGIGDGLSLGTWVLGEFKGERLLGSLKFEVISMEEWRRWMSIE